MIPHFARHHLADPAFAIALQGGGGDLAFRTGGAKRRPVLAETILGQRPVFTQGSSVVERQSHTLEVAGSIPAPAPISVH